MANTTFQNLINLINARLGKAAYKDVPTSGDAANDEVVLGNDTRLKVATSIADTFSSTASYAVGDRVMYNGALYKCTTAHSGAWDSTHFASETVADNIESYKEVIVTVATSDWSSSQTSGYYTATITTPAFSTAMPPKLSCAGSGMTIKPTTEQLAAYRNIQNPNGYIEQLSSTSIKLYAKTKPTDTFYIKLCGYGIGSQIDSCQLANQLQNRMTYILTGRSNSSHSYYDGSATQYFNLVKRVITVNSSNWSSSPNSAGYYTLEMGIGGFDFTYGVTISCTGSTENSPPTSAQMAAYRNICGSNGYVKTSSGDKFTFYAKTKPTETFYILIEGANLY